MHKAPRIGSFSHDGNLFQTGHEPMQLWAVGSHNPSGSLPHKIQRDFPHIQKGVPSGAKFSASIKWFELKYVQFEKWIETWFMWPLSIRKTLLLAGNFCTNRRTSLDDRRELSSIFLFIETFLLENTIFLMPNSCYCFQFVNNNMSAPFIPIHPLSMRRKSHFSEVRGNTFKISIGKRKLISLITMSYIDWGINGIISIFHWPRLTLQQPYPKHEKKDDFNHL